MSWRTPNDHAKATDPILRALASMIRRTAIGLTSAAGAASGIWQVLGPKIAGKAEASAAEAWQGIGFASRPRAGRGEAIVIAVGAAGNAAGGAQAIVATRDEALRQLAAGALGEDETAIFTSKAIVVIKADGTVEVRSIGGSAQALATKHDLDVLRSAISTAGIAVGAAGAAAIVTACDAAVAPHAWPEGTSVLKGE